jgi:PKD repeat protein
MWWMLARISGWDGGTGQPTADFSVTPETGDVSVNFGFDASLSNDTDGSIVSYSWNYGDGTTDSGMIVTHRFESPGDFDVVLSVTDNEGNTDSTTKTIVVNESVPGTLAFSDASYTVPENENSITITINRVNGSAGEVSVSFETLDDTAVAGTDYIQTSGTLTWLYGDISPKSFSIDILDDDETEGNETVLIHLRNPEGTNISGTNPVTLSIRDDDLSQEQSLVF